jgi:hypothetical protein
MLRLKKSENEAAAAASAEAEEEDIEAADDDLNRLVKRSMSMMRLRRFPQQKLFNFNANRAIRGGPSLMRLRKRGPSLMRLRKRISQFRLKKSDHEMLNHPEAFCLYFPDLC